MRSSLAAEFGSRPSTTSGTKGHVKSASVSSPGPSSDNTTSTQTDPLRQRLGFSFLMMIFHNL